MRLSKLNIKKISLKDIDKNYSGQDILIKLGELYQYESGIYGYGNLAGRGGWTWYTGSSSWMLKAGLEYILGLKIQNRTLKIEPCIASTWKEYSIRYKYGESIYNIKVKNPNGRTNTVEKVILNGIEVEDKRIKLNPDGNVNEIEIFM